MDATALEFDYHNLSQRKSLRGKNKKFMGKDIESHIHLMHLPDVASR